MLLHLPFTVNLVALGGCTFLLLFWLVASRRLLGFFCMCLGWSLILAVVFGDGTERMFLTLLLAGAFCSCLCSVLCLVLRARRHRVPVYVPLDRRRHGRG